MFVGALCHSFIGAEYPRPVLHAPFVGVSESSWRGSRASTRPATSSRRCTSRTRRCSAILLIRDRPVLGRVALVMATMLALSTMTTKQHFVADVISGYVLAFIGAAWALWRLPRLDDSPRRGGRRLLVQLGARGAADRGP